MSLYYAKTDRYEDEELEYSTWKWNDGMERGSELGWEKVSVPNFISSEAEQAASWFKTSNREDQIFLEKEKVACQYWYDKEMKEILLAQKNENLYVHFRFLKKNKIL